jgi:hypothetical protein
MSVKKFELHCPGCKPVVIHPKLGKLPDDHPLMQVVMSVYNRFTLEEKTSFHAVMVLNSRERKDLAVVVKIQAAVAEANLRNN